MRHAAAYKYDPFTGSTRGYKITNFPDLSATQQTQLFVNPSRLACSASVSSFVLQPGKIELRRLITKTLSLPLTVIIEPDSVGFLARCPDLPLYGHGDDWYEAIDMLKHEIESLYADLMQDDNFNKEFLAIKKLLMRHVD